MVYDEVIVGSGPSAYGYILGSDAAKNRLVVTTCKHDQPTAGAVAKHAKISHEGKSLIEPFDNGSVFLTTSAEGGLSNAWGGVLFSGGVDEYRRVYPNETSINEDVYSDVVDAILKDLGKFLNVRSLNLDGYCKAHILDSDQEFGWENGSLNIVTHLRELINSKHMHYLIATKLVHVDYDDKVYTLHLSNSNGIKIVKTKKIILGAGVTGNKMILSYLNILTSDIVDHVPLQIAALTSAKQKLNMSNAPTLNTPVCGLHKKADTIFTVYDLDRISLKGMRKLFGLAGFIAKQLSFLGVKIALIQCWNDSTYSNNTSSSKAGNILKIIRTITKQRVLPVFWKTTRAGQGFHYHATAVDNAHVRNGNIVLLGGLSAASLPIYHPSLFYMIDAYLKGQVK